MVVLCFEISMSFAAGAFSSGVRGGGGGGDGGARRLFSRIKGKFLFASPHIIESDRLFFDPEDMLHLILIPEAS